jgi:hypothetical protein
MFQLPPGMNYKQFQAAGFPGYKSDAMPFNAQHPNAQSIPGYASDGRGGYTNAAGGSVRQSSRYGNAQPEAPSIPRYDQAQPMQPQGRGTPYPGGSAGALAPDAAPGTRDTPGPGSQHWYGDDWRPSPTLKKLIDQNRWQPDLTGIKTAGNAYAHGTPQSQPSQPTTPTIQKYGSPDQQPVGPDGGPWRTGGRLPRPDQMGQHIYQPSYGGSPQGLPPGENFSPFGGSPFSDSWVKQPRNDMFGGGQYTNGQGQGFMGSMSFAPGTPASYQNQAYGNWANSQGYFQPPSPGTPYGVLTRLQSPPR